MNKCRLFPYEEKANIAIIIRDVGNRYYSLIPVGQEAKKSVTRVALAVRPTNAEYFLIGKRLLSLPSIRSREENVKKYHRQSAHLIKYLF